MIQQTDKKHNYFYRITNQINWKFYFGIHSTDNLDDGYMGSGVVLQDSISKHGVENFSMTIIQDYPTRKEASEHERLAVTEIQVFDEQCYNLKTGGENGGIYYHSDDSKKNMSDAKLGKYCGENSWNFGRKFTDEHKQKLKDSRREFLKNNINPNVGRICSEETKEKLREKRKGFTHSDETKKELSELGKRKTKFITRQCLIEGKIFESIVDAMTFFDMTENQIRMRCSSELEKWNDWKFGEKKLTIRKFKNV